MKEDRGSTGTETWSTRRVARDLWISDDGRTDEPRIIEVPDPPWRPSMRAVAAAALVLVVAVVAVAAWVLFDRDVSVEGTDLDGDALHIGEYRSLTDGGVAIDMRCARTAPQRFGSPCLADDGWIARVLDGRDEVVLIGNLATVSNPDGELRCLTVSHDGPVHAVRCPDHGFRAG